MKTIALDYDGPVHRYSKGWNGGSIYDEPTSGAFDAIRRLQERFEVVIYTSRVWTPTGDLDGWQVDAIRHWFNKHGAVDLADLPITSTKIPASAYIDDRAVQFRDWPQAEADLEELLLRVGSIS